MKHVSAETTTGMIPSKHMYICTFLFYYYYFYSLYIIPSLIPYIIKKKTNERHIVAVLVNRR